MQYYVGGAFALFIATGIRPPLHQMAYDFMFPPKRKLLVFDLNNVLLYRRWAPECPPEKREGAKEIGNFFVWVRPGVQDFLGGMHWTGDVGMWTSAQAQNVKDLIPLVSPFPLRWDDYQEPATLKFVWDQSDCTPIERPGATHPLYVKDLRKLRKEYPDHQIVAVDDSPKKILSRHTLGSCVIIKPWTPYDPDSATSFEEMTSLINEHVTTRFFRNLWTWIFTK